MRHATRNSEVSSVWLAGAGRALARRLMLAGLAAAFGVQLLPARAHDIGLVKPPIDVPNVTVVSADGVRVSLSDLLRGRAWRPAANVQK